LHDFLYFNHNNNRAIRAGDWKILATGQGGPWELYNLRDDRSELRNLAGGEAGRVQQLAALWKEQDDAFVRIRESSPPSTRPRMRAGG
jgi:arylsulfatase A-like enzyme